ncbi:MAG: hypothetical protein IK016_11045 [Lachnospiraceae bacterium]|nr:hypothetical protein [Lachnospiraceae bacterium]
MDKTKWIKELAEDESLWALDEMTRRAWPAPIVNDYLRLREQMEKGNVYGAMLAFRDLYEVSLKIPTLMALIYMDHKDEDKLTGNQNIMRILTQKPMSSGAWYELSVEINKAAKAFSIPADLVDVICATQDVYRLKVGDYPDIVAWRNDTIGHGALKFENHDDYRKEIHELMHHYREYVFKLEKEKPSYQECFFVLNDIPLIGDVDMDSLTDGNPALSIQGETIMLGKFSSGKRFLLDSFYARRRAVKYVDCYSGETETTSDKLFLSYFQMKLRLNEGVTKRYLSTEDDLLLKKMHEPDKYKKPVKLLERINTFFDNPDGRGLLLLSMERGTGKTAFCYSMDGLMTRSLIKNAVVRSYSFATAQIRGMSDFINAMNEDFRRKSYHSADVIRPAEEGLPRIRLDEKEPAVAMAHLLNAYQKLYRETEGIDRLVLVVDGLDEITKQTERVADFIPDGEQLNEGVFVICTSRFSDEPDVSDFVATRIASVRKKADVCIDIRRDDPINQAVLKEYAAGWIQSNHRKNISDMQTEELLKMADYRLLRLKILLPLLDVLSDVGSTETDAFRCYMEYLQSCSDEKSFQKMLQFFVAIAQYGQLSLEEYCDLIGADDLSYAFIGRLNDMMPVLTAKSTGYGRVYELSNWQYRLYLLEHYHDKVESVMRQFQSAFSFWVEDFCNGGFGERKEEQFRICDFWVQSIASMRQCADNYHLEELFYQTDFVNDVYRFATEFESRRVSYSDRVESMKKRICQLSLTLIEQCVLHDGYGSETPLLFPKEYRENKFWLFSDMKQFNETFNELFPVIINCIVDRIMAGDNVEHLKDWIVIPEEAVFEQEEERELLNNLFGMHISRMVTAFCEADRIEELLQWVLHAQIEASIHLRRSEGGLVYTCATRYTLYLQEILRHSDIASDVRERVTNALEEQIKLDNKCDLQDLRDELLYDVGCLEDEDLEPIEALRKKLGVPDEKRLTEWLAEIKQLQIPSEESLGVFRYLMQYVSRTANRIRLLSEYVYGYDTENYYRIVFEKPVPDSIRNHILCTDNVIDLYLLCQGYGDHTICHKLCRDVGRGVRRQYQDDAEHLDYYRLMAFSDICVAAGEDVFADMTDEIIVKWVETETQKALRALDEINPYTSYASFKKEAGLFMEKLFLNKRFDVLRNHVLAPIFQKLDTFIRTSENRKLLWALEKELQGVEQLVAYECEKKLPDSFIHTRGMGVVDIYDSNIFDTVDLFHLAASVDGIVEYIPYEQYYDQENGDAYQEDGGDGFGEARKNEVNKEKGRFSKLSDKAFGLKRFFGQKERKEHVLEESYCKRVRDVRIAIISD